MNTIDNEYTYVVPTYVLVLDYLLSEIVFNVIINNLFELRSKTERKFSDYSWQRTNFICFVYSPIQQSFLTFLRTVLPSSYLPTNMHPEILHINIWSNIQSQQEDTVKKTADIFVITLVIMLHVGLEFGCGGCTCSCILHFFGPSSQIIMIQLQLTLIPCVNK